MATVAPDTSQGTILGTVQYMAPEQVEGNEADARSDIWALGAVTYEMVTGVRAFTGDTPASVISSILRDRPAAISRRQPLVPHALDRLIDQCLAKDRDERWQNIGDVRRVLESIAANQTADSGSRARHSGGWRERTVWMSATALLLIALALNTRRPAPVVPPGEIVRLSVNPPASADFTPGMYATVPIPQFALSPDGRTLAFVAGPPTQKPTLWLRQLEDVEARSLAGTEDAHDPFWSPDGRWIGFFDVQGTLKRVAVSGGTVHAVTRTPSDARGASWGQDDTILFGTVDGAVYRVAAASGTPQPVTQLNTSNSEGSHRWPQFLPDGRHFLFTVRSGLADHRGVYVGALGEGTRQQLLRLDSDAHYVAPGYLLFLDGDTLMAQAFDSDRLRLSGQATPIESRASAGPAGETERSHSREPAHWPTRWPCGDRAASCGSIAAGLC
jgi:serine/threonine-protein kinase